MFTPQASTVFEVSMNDIDRVATEAYGRTYKGQQTGDMTSNDTYHTYDFPDKESCKECANLGDMSSYRGWVLGHDMYYSVQGWLARDTSNDKYDFDDYRTAPIPGVMIATLILDGHLPYGRYVVEVSW